MDKVEANTTAHGRATTGIDAATAGPGRRATGILLMLTSSASNQTGAALGALAFPTIGPVGVVAVRQIVTALVLVPFVRPRFRGLSRSQWWPVLGLTLVFSVMNLTVFGPKALPASPA